MNEVGESENLYAWSTSEGVVTPANTSAQCARHLELFFEDAASLSIATEASSHPSGLVALESQPWAWAGGGLGNIDECPLQTCIAGANLRRDSLTFASLCIVPECTAHDLEAVDFLEVLNETSVKAVDETLGIEYSRLVTQITKVNCFLQTGWICGDFVVPWTMVPFGLVFVIVASVSLMGISIRCFSRARRRRATTSSRAEEEATAENLRLASFESDEEKKEDVRFDDEDDEERNEDAPLRLQLSAEVRRDHIAAESEESIWKSFDVHANIQELWVQKSSDTLILDGLRVGSICWIIVGHVMAITGSVSGFSNPKEVFPPTGYLASWSGQLVLSSRFGVDTFLIISGFLTFHVLNRKLPLRANSGSVVYRFFTNLPKLFVARAIRVLPLYMMALLFYTQIAPHLGGGPFWYQWLVLLKPCHDYGWTNLLFVNNFVPFDVPTTGTCFYHSWYLAVDMQLFVLSSCLVFWHQANPLRGKLAAATLWLLSLGVGTYLAIIRRWSVNTFDGAAVARYDAEAYSKPHIRAQAYLTGFFVAMLLPKRELAQRRSYTWKHQLVELLALVSMAFVTFITHDGANSRRPCRYQEWPEQSDCGSDWSNTANWLYTSMSRTIWCIGTGALMYLFLGRPSDVSAVSSILSWRCWTPLSRLSFAVYLIHPIIIFSWELGSTEKEVFRPISFGMKVISVCVVSYVVALVAALLIEIPAANLWKSSSRLNLTQIREHWTLSFPIHVIRHSNNTSESRYGSIQAQDVDKVGRGTVL